jgi:nanoRNase/pAp phosphatase (c-di-AMP/oligoRNAs hydrolase)
MPQRGQAVLAPETFLDRMLEDLRIPGRALVVTHDNPDPDSLASAYGLKTLFESELGRETVIGYAGMIGRAENRALVEACQIPVVPLESLDYADFGTVALVDSQPQTGNNSIPPDARVDLVIDHHPLRDHTTVRSRWVDVRPDFGASATIVGTYLQSKEIRFPPLLATAFFYAIKSETQDLGQQAHEADRKLYFHLFPLVDPQVLYEITHPRVSHEYFRIIGDLARQTVLYNGAAVAYIGGISTPDFVAEMADQLMRLEKVDWALCMGSHGTDFLMSLRTSHRGGGAGQMIQRIVRGLGQAGGHGMMAGGRIRQVPEDRKSRQNMATMMRDRFLTELGLTGAPGRSILDD